MTPDHKQIMHDLNLRARIRDYMDELDNLDEEVESGEVSRRLWNIISRADNASFELSLTRPPKV